MTKKKNSVQVVPLLRQSVNILVGNPVILLPFITIAFVQLVILEVLYFSPRFPLIKFFGPIVQRLWGEAYLHYPFNFSLLPKLFQFAQIPVYIFISGYFIAVSMAIIKAINNGQSITFSKALRQTITQYVHIIVTAIISFSLFYGCANLYGLTMARAFKIRSTSGVFFTLKMIILKGAPYFNILLGVLVTTLLAFVLPAIVIERKKVFAAFIENFKTIWRPFFKVLLIVLLPTLVYLPVVLLRNSVPVIAETSWPNLRFLVLVLSVVVMVVVDAIVYTGITMFYLLKKEE